MATKNNNKIVLRKLENYYIYMYVSLGELKKRQQQQHLIT